MDRQVTHFPPDPKHGRRLPTGSTIAKAMRAVFHRQQVEIVAAIRQAGGVPFHVPRLDRYTGAMIKIFTPILEPFYHQGAREAAVQIGAKIKPRKSGGTGVPPAARLQAKLHAGRHGGALLALRVKDSTPDFFGFDVQNPRVIEYIRTQIFHFIDSTNETSAELLRTALEQARLGGETPQELYKRVQAIFGSPNRSFMIGVTESSRSLHAGELMLAKESGVVEAKEWLASSDACPLCLKLDGTVKKLDEPFMVNGFGPYATIMHPGAHPMCMCTQTLVIGATADILSP